MPELIYAIEKDVCRCILKNALYIPNFKQNIFSVQPATKNGVHINFEHDNCQFIYPNGAVFSTVLFEKYCLWKKCFLWLTSLA